MTRIVLATDQVEGARSVLASIAKLAFIAIAIEKIVNALSVFLIRSELPLVAITIAESQAAAPLKVVVLTLAFVTIAAHPSINATAGDTTTALPSVLCRQHW